MFKRAFILEGSRELKELYKDRELPRTKRLVNIENDHDNGETVADACREKASMFYNFRSMSYHVCFF